MPVARIVTNVALESPAIEELLQRLRAAGYEVVIAPTSGEADLVVEVDEFSTADALEVAAHLAAEDNADVYIAPGVFGAGEPALREVAEAPPQSGQERSIPTSDPPGVHIAVEHGGVVASTLEELGAALADGRAGVRDTVSSLQERIFAAWSEWRKRRDEAGLQRRLERERREIGREERRRRHEIELQRRAEEKEQLLAERERLAAEQARVLREQLAREVAARAERERIECEVMARAAAERAERERMERETMAREAARRAEIARIEEEERREAALAAERLRVVREPESEPVTAPETQEWVARRQRGPVDVDSVAEQPLSTADPERVPSMPSPRPRRVRPRRRIPTSRERQWQRAALVASIATLAAMLGFAIATTMAPSAPLPTSLMENKAQQQVPFGPARMDVSSTKTAKPAAVPLRTAPAKPTAAKPVPHRARRVSRERDIVAEDEVIVRHAPTSKAQRAQSTGVRRFSDEN